MDRCPGAPLRPLPSSNTGLSRLRDPLSRRAVPTTPMDRSGCICRLLPQIVLPSPFSGQVGVHDFNFEACSGFTHVTARRFAPPPHSRARSPKVRFIAGLRYGQLPNRTACQLPGQPTIARVGLAPTRWSRPFGTHQRPRRKRMPSSVISQSGNSTLRTLRALCGLCVETRTPTRRGPVDQLSVDPARYYAMPSNGRSVIQMMTAKPRIVRPQCTRDRKSPQRTRAMDRPTVDHYSAQIE
jgi:hypothetical protein